MKMFYLIALIFIFEPVVGHSAEFPAQARLFIGSTSADPDNLNQEMTAQGLRKFSSIGKYGVEITYPVMKSLNVGINYSRRYLSQDETDSNTTTNYEGVINQDAVLLLARAQLYKTSFMLADVFAGVGGTNTTFSMRSASQDGELTRRESGDWFASPVTAFGASVAFGFNNVYFFVEGGVESNKVDSFKRSGTINNNIQTINLSGNYVTVGILFDGIKATSK